MSSAAIRITESARSWALAACLGFFSSIGTLRAAEPAPTASQAQAARLFEEALRAYDNGQLELAIEKLRTAYSAAPSPQVLYNLAQFQEAAGHRADASLSFERYLSLAGSALTAGREQAVRAKLAELLKHVTKLKIRTEPAGALVSVDGVEVAEPLVLEPGQHELLASAPGFLPFQLELNAEAGDTVQVIATLVPEQATEVTPPSVAPVAPATPRNTSVPPHPTPTVQPAADAKARHWSRTWATALVGTGAALAAGAVVTYAVGSQQRGAWEAENHRLDAIDPSSRNDAYWRARADNTERSRSIRQLQGLELGLLIGAAVVGTAGVGVWLTSPSDSSKVASGVTYSGAW